MLPVRDSRWLLNDWICAGQVRKLPGLHSIGDGQSPFPVPINVNTEDWQIDRWCTRNETYDNRLTRSRPYLSQSATGFTDHFGSTLLQHGTPVIIAARVRTTGSGTSSYNCYTTVNAHNKSMIHIVPVPSRKYSMHTYIGFTVPAILQMNAAEKSNGVTTLKTLPCVLGRLFQ